MLNAEKLSVLYILPKEKNPNQCRCAHMVSFIHLLSFIYLPIITCVMLETSEVAGQELS